MVTGKKFRAQNLLGGIWWQLAANLANMLEKMTPKVLILSENFDLKVYSGIRSTLIERKH